MVLTVPLTIRVEPRTPSVAELVAQVNVVVIGERMVIKVVGTPRSRDVQYIARPARNLASRSGKEEKVGWDVSNAREGAGGGLESGSIYWRVRMLKGILSGVLELIGLEYFPRIVLEEDGRAKMSGKSPSEVLF
jgi:hypothetical protein